MNQPIASLRKFHSGAAILAYLAVLPAFAAEPLPIYQPKVKTADIYFHHPGAKPPSPVTAAAAIRLVERGALLMEDFDAAGMNTKLWRIEHQDSARTTVAQQGGRLDLTARGLIGMNGFWGLGGVKHKDVVLVGEMDIRSTGAPPHCLALHLCGGDGKRSPDHWTEIAMVDLGDKARFFPVSALPEGFERRFSQFLELPHPPGRGFLCRIELNGVTNLAELWVKADDGWRRVCEPIELPLRTVHAEVKLNGNYGRKPGAPEEATSRAWFDNVRVYPRPRSHSVGLRLVGPRGGAIFTREGRGWPPMITDAAGRVRKISDLRVELRTEDGSQLVASVESTNFGFYLMPLKDAPWDVYPVAAQVRVLLDGKVLGQPLLIQRKACEGLYPDDVYDVVME
jgi:hypothetical protein